MILRERLHSLGYRAPPRPRSLDVDLQDVAARLGAEVRENRHGAALVVEELVRLPRPGAYDSASARLLGATWDTDPPESGLCFFDTETTGLSGGVGTQIFLAALGWRTADGFLLRQYLLPDPALEPAFLEAVADDLEASDALVTYNGKTFDAPMLENRLLLARRPTGVPKMPHLDLLHPVRRVFKNRLGGCTLGSVEQDVLGGDRGEDIPGFVIPDMYFTFLRYRDPSALRPVMAHNRQDVLSLSLLLDHLCAALSRSPDGHPLDRFGFARLLEARGLEARALEDLERLWDELTGRARPWDGEVWPATWSPPELAYVVGLRLARLLRRHGRQDRAAEVVFELWRRHPKAWAAGVALAKDLEHRRRDPSAALEVVEAALEELELQGERDDRWRGDLRRRQHRLSRKVAREKD